MEIEVYERLARLETLAEGQAAVSAEIKDGIANISAKVDALRLWKAKVGGIAFAAGALGSLIIKYLPLGGR